MSRRSDLLPSGWAEARLGEVAEARAGYTFPPAFQGRQTGEIPFAKVGDISRAARSGLVIDSAVNYVDRVDLARLRARTIPPGSVVFAKIGEAIRGNRKVMTGREMLIDNNAMALVPRKDVIAPGFLLHVMRTIDLYSLASATTVPSIRKTDLESIVIPLPPIAEQRRVETFLNSAYVRHRHVAGLLDGIPLLLEQFRQSVLTAAFRGELTADWREEQQDGSALQWTETTLGQLAELVTSGSRGWADYYAADGAVFIRAQDINEDRLRLDETARVRLPDGAEGQRTRVRRGDLLITITGANVTKAALVEVDLPEAYVSQHVALVRLRDPANAAFLHLWLTSDARGRGHLLDVAYGGGKPGLNLTNIRDVPIAFPTLAEQRELHRRVQSLFAGALATERSMASACNQLSRLDDSIMSKAFRGELVPQDPSDEPASVLLERIHAGRAMQPKKPGGRPAPQLR